MSPFLFSIIQALFTFLNIMIFARVILSWLPQVLTYHPIRRAVFQFTEPLLAPIRNLMPSAGGVDFSPIILLLGLSLLQRLVYGILLA